MTSAHPRRVQPRRTRNQWIARSRIVLGWTLAELAERADVPIETLEIVENGSPLDPRFEPRIREAIRAAFRALVAPLVSRACARVSQRRMEAILGLSQGYLSRLANGSGTPSPPLVALLTLLANDPSRLDEVVPRTAQPATPRRPVRVPAPPAFRRWFP